MYKPITAARHFNGFKLYESFHIPWPWLFYTPCSLILHDAAQRQCKVFQPVLPLPLAEWLHMSNEYWHHVILTGETTGLVLVADWFQEAEKGIIQYQ